MQVKDDRRQMGLMERLNRASNFAVVGWLKFWAIILVADMLYTLWKTHHG